MNRIKKFNAANRKGLKVKYSFFSAWKEEECWAIKREGKIFLVWSIEQAKFLYHNNKYSIKDVINYAVPIFVILFFLLLLIKYSL